MKIELVELIDKIFGENGSIVQLGGRYSHQQHTYAQHVGLSLIEEKKVAFLEAETGIGKSLGYFIPVMLVLYLQKQGGQKAKPIAISTYTRQLQKQIFHKDASFAKNAINAIGIDVSDILVAYRMGRTSFFSLSRTKIACENLLSQHQERKDELDNFFHYVIKSCESGSGLLSDWLSEFGAFPDGIKTKDICLLSRQKVDNEAYLYHLQQAKHADCLITNHATLINFKQVGIESKTFSAIIFDESHKIESSCKDHFNFHSSYKELIKSLTSTSELYPRVKQIKTAIQLLEELGNKILATHQQNKVNYITHVNSPKEMESYFQVIEKINSLLKIANKKIDTAINHCELAANDANTLNEFDKSVNTLNLWKPKQSFPHIISAIHFSPVIRKLSFATINLFASRLMAWMCNEMADRTIFTSATISDNKAELSFKVIANTLGYREEDIGQQCSLSPLKYGDMKFILTSKKINAPIKTIEEDRTEFNSEWLDNVVDMIKAAHSEGGAVLCLTTSHYESKIISSELALTETSVLCHKKNTALNEYLSDFENGNSNILITSAGWEGLDVRKLDKSQLIKHVVISRIPFTPPDDLLEYFYNEYAKLKIKEGNYQAQSISWLNQINNVVPKLKQGLGRGVRSPEDSVTIWIADPRMPHGRSDRTNTTLMYAIPKRFISAYHKAKIFGELNKEVFMV